MSGIDLKVVIPFIESNISEMCYGIDLARRMGVPVYVLVSNDAVLALSRARVSKDLVFSRIEKKIKDLGADDIKIVENIPSGAICVSNHLWKIRQDVSVLAPFDERVVSRKKVGEIMIPFGSRNSALVAAPVAVALAKIFGVGIFCYHTARKIEGMLPVCPSCHMHKESRKNLGAIFGIATEADVPKRFIAECTDSIVKGISMTALRENVSLIVMARNKNTGMGFHADQLIVRESLTPVLVVGNNQGDSC